MGKLILNGIEYAGGPSIDDTNSSATKVYSSQKTQNLVSGTLGADVYDPTHTYATNDMCIYNNTLYKAKSSTTGNLPTNTTYWASTTIADEINELDSGKIKRTSKTIYLGQITFTQSASGMYYYEETINLPSGSLIVSISCGNWGKLRSTGIIEPYIAGSTKLGLMSNIGTFLNDSVIELIVIYI